MRRHLILLAYILATTALSAQEFFNLTAQEVKIDSVLPVFTHQIALGRDYAGTDYEVSIEYPEFIDMQPSDVQRLRQMGVADALPELPRVEKYVAVERKRGTLCLSLVPLVKRDGRYQKLVSFKLAVTSRNRNEEEQLSRTSHLSPRYASHSVLATGQWAKIRVPATGVYQLTDALVRKAGFADASKVKVYGYGGALQPEALTGDYLTATDDLKEVATCTVGGRRLFHATGPVSWESATAEERTRNYCSDYGYYFLTESDAEPLTQDSAAFVSSFYPSADDYHSLWEKDGYAWYHSGRNLYSPTALSTSQPTTFTLDAHEAEETLVVAMSYNGAFVVSVTVNDSVVGQMEVTASQAKSDFSSEKYASAGVRSWKFSLTGLRQGANTIGLQQTSGSCILRPDYVALVSANPRPAPSLSTDEMPVPEYVYRITNQDHHADSAVQMVIIIPTSQKLLEQARRLKQLHEEHDSLRVSIVPADELFNEFSSGTPDVSAYRRYLKMFYDRADSDDELPRYLLLLGDGAWDNRMVSTAWRSYQPDDFLLCYESENSFSNTYSFVSDDFFCLLDDEETIKTGSSYRGKPDVAVGRIPARTVEEAKIAVDNVIAYVGNSQAGSWQNTICMMADDGNGNRHMEDAEAVASVVNSTDKAYHIKKVYWDAYTREVSLTGNSYPEVERLLKQQMNDGALIMDYSGHGAAYCIAHEKVLQLADFKNASSGGRMPVWITASCDIAPFDTQEENIGETALFNANGGAIAFLGTARTVFMTQNRQTNKAFMRRVLDSTDGKPNTIGEALRQAKNDLVDDGGDTSQNKLHYVLLGDPAVALARPTQQIVIDSVAGKAVADGDVHLNAGSSVTVKGHVEGLPSFTGIASLTVFDVEETIVCKLNEYDSSYPDVTNYTYQTRPNIIYSGSDSIVGGQFTLTFAVPKDISYSSESGQIIAYGVSDDRLTEAHGQHTGLVLDGDELPESDGVGPNIYCYLNSETFQNGGTVNSTPYFYATLTDKDGINAAGSGIGHDMELIVDGDMQRTYNLNSYFQFDFGDYRSGTVGYSLPTLSDGPHKLLFRAWDVLNNASTAELQFVVDSALEPSIINVVCTKNPASTTTRFLIDHDRTGSEMDVTLQVLDTSGRLLWQRTETGVATDHTYTVDWDLTTSSGSRLRSGVYLYRILVSSGGSSEASVARKLIVK